MFKLYNLKNLKFGRLFVLQKELISGHSTQEKIIQELVNTRFKLESGIQKIFVLSGKHEQDCIRLLEIDCNTIKAGIVPIYERFKDTCVIIISIDPVEFYKLKLPYDWKLGREFTRKSQ
jgi:hypothetical protein